MATDSFTLAKELYDAACYGDVNLVKDLLKEGATPNAVLDYGWTPLMIAAAEGHAEVADILLKAGALTTLTGTEKTAAEVANENGHYDIAQAINSFIAETPELVVYRTQVGNRTLEEIFNFNTLERLSLIREHTGGSVEAAFSKNFSELADETMLRDAFNEHVRRGGKVAEEKVFPGTKKLDKNPSL